MARSGLLAYLSIPIVGNSAISERPTLEGYDTTCSRGKIATTSGERRTKKGKEREKKITRGTIWLDFAMDETFFS